VLGLGEGRPASSIVGAQVDRMRSGPGRVIASGPHGGRVPESPWLIGTSGMGDVHPSTLRVGRPDRRPGANSTPRGPGDGRCRWTCSWVTSRGARPRSWPNNAKADGIPGAAAALVARLSAVAPDPWPVARRSWPRPGTFREKKASLRHDDLSRGPAFLPRSGWKPGPRGRGNFNPRRVPRARGPDRRPCGFAALFGSCRTSSSGARSVSGSVKDPFDPAVRSTRVPRPSYLETPIAGWRKTLRWLVGRTKEGRARQYRVPGSRGNPDVLRGRAARPARTAPAPSPLHRQWFTPGMPALWPRFLWSGGCLFPPGRTLKDTRADRDQYGAVRHPPLGHRHRRVRAHPGIHGRTLRPLVPVRGRSARCSGRTGGPGSFASPGGWKHRRAGAGRGGPGPTVTRPNPGPEELHNAEVEPICRKYLELRYRLMPLPLQRCLRGGTGPGLPIIRSLWASTTPDEAGRRGPGAMSTSGAAATLLVAPVTEEGGEVPARAYLPRGDLVRLSGPTRSSKGGREVRAAGRHWRRSPCFAPGPARSSPMGPRQAVPPDEPVAGPRRPCNVYPGADGRFCALRRRRRQPRPAIGMAIGWASRWPGDDRPAPIDAPAGRNGSRLRPPPAPRVSRFRLVPEEETAREVRFRRGAGRLSDSEGRGKGDWPSDPVLRAGACPLSPARRPPPPRKGDRPTPRKTRSQSPFRASARLFKHGAGNTRLGSRQRTPLRTLR